MKGESIKLILTMLLVLALASCDSKRLQEKDFDVIISNGILYDGLGNEPIKSDIGITGEYISQIGDLANFTSKQHIDA